MRINSGQSGLVPRPWAEKNLGTSEVKRAPDHGRRELTLTNRTSHHCSRSDRDAFEMTRPGVGRHVQGRFGYGESKDRY